MKNGFTTGSCAAAAAKAATYMLLSKERTGRVEIITPSGTKYAPMTEETEIGEGHASCAVRKQSGDDPDITDGILVFAKVSHIEDSKAEVVIDGAAGIGRVTRPGLDQPVGAAAINSVPRKMIENEVRSVMEQFDHSGSLKVEISVPQGETLALKTFNPRLGIEGGISIIGTTGIVEPMSTKALLDTIRTELRQQKCMGAKIAVISPGNYGTAFMKEKYGYDLDRAVKCANYIGDTLDMAADEGFDKVLLCGHIGKLIKVSGGIMNTHSKEADCRMELMAAAAIRCGADADTVTKILDCVSTEEAIQVYDLAGIRKACFEHIMEKIAYYLDRRSADRIDTECIVYSNQYGILGKTQRAEEFINKAKGNM